MQQATKRSSGRLAIRLLMGPVVGFLYVIFLPLAAIIATIGMIAAKVAGRLFDALINAVPFGWRPSEAYLAGRGKNGGRRNNRKETKQ